MKLIHLTQAHIDAFPEGAIWNAFIELLARSEPQELSAVQRPAQRGFWYDSEVQNGGHLQYFLNRGIIEAQAAVLDLHELGAAKFSELLVEAISTWQRGGRADPGSAVEYLALAAESEFEHIDERYYAISPSLMEILEEHLENYQDRYVSID